ncbi:MAG TPA: group I intron-associated PD-(D/E)XK endonuclease [Polyangiaceae bacterium]|nr:group I intron-associated PD-(D/E)XK endonuclease [Polyangiaceae bacterium]
MPARSQPPYKVVPSESALLSKQLQIGKAAEHLVCAELILHGYNAFLTDAGLPYDIMVDAGNSLLRIQVKSSWSPYQRERDRGRAPTSSYRFSLRHGTRYRRMTTSDVDVFAFVALDVRRIAYLRAEELFAKDGRLKRMTEFCDEIDGRRWGVRTFQKCAEFPLAPVDVKRHACFRCGKVYPHTSDYFAPNKKCRDGATGTCRPCYRIADAEMQRTIRARKRAAAERNQLRLVADETDAERGVV